MLPVFVTTKLNVTVEPIATTGPGAESASEPLTSFSRSNPGNAPK